MRGTIMFRRVSTEGKERDDDRRLSHGWRGGDHGAPGVWIKKGKIEVRSDTEHVRVLVRCGPLIRKQRRGMEPKWNN